ncbi:MAG: TRAP transporter small permease subunit [Cytophagales bacterium]|nr:TRAP transporter small permease subunit [Cytophagales bacterium]
MKFISQIINRFNDLIGQTISWMALILVLLIVVDVFLRYVFQFSSPAVFELEWHLFAALFLLGAGWTFKNDQHVRVDLFYQKFSEKGKAVVNLLGTLILLLPFCVVGFIESLEFALNSLNIGETSPDPGGLPARYIIKSCIPISFLLLGLQGISTLLTSTLTLTQK